MLHPLDTMQHRLYSKSIMQHKEYLTIPELAKIMGLSRSQVFRKVQAGLIPHQKVGRIYLISKDYANSILGDLTEEDQKQIEKAVKKVVRQYGDVIKKLGAE